MDPTVPQEELTLYLNATQIIRGFSDIATIDYWEDERPTRILPVVDNSEGGKETKALLTLLDWLAQCFVSGARGDVIAAAIALITGSPTLYISNNSCKLAGSKIKELKSSIENLVTESFHSYQEGKLKTEESKRHAQNNFLIQTCTYSWPRVIAKLKKAQYSSEDMTDKGVTGVKTNFERIYKLWHNKLHNIPIPEDGKIELPEAQKNTLANLSYQLVQLCEEEIPQIGDIEERIYFLNKAIQIGIAILNSSIMLHISDAEKRRSIGLSKEDVGFLGKLYRRLTRIIKFQAEVLRFLNEGLKTIVEIWNRRTNKAEQDKFSLNVVFVFEAKNQGFQRNVLHYRKTTVTSTKFYTVIKTIRDEAIKDIPDKSPQVLSQLDKKLRQLTDDGLVYEARYHCETTLVLFLSMNGITVERNVIGVSKYMCWSCTKFFGKLETLTKTRWLLSGSSGKSHHAWKYPTAALFTTVPGMEEFVIHFNTASKAVGELALTELKEVFRSFFKFPPPNPSGPHGAAISIPKPPPSTQGTPENKTKGIKPEEKLPGRSKEVGPKAGAMARGAKGSPQKETQAEAKPTSQITPAAGIKHRPQGSDSSVGSISSDIMSEMFVLGNKTEKDDSKKGSQAKKH